MGCSPWGGEGLDVTERPTLFTPSQTVLMYLVFYLGVKLDTQDQDGLGCPSGSEVLL